MARRSREQIAFIKKYPKKYRIAVIRLLYKYRKENEWATPLSIIDDVAASFDIRHEDIHEAMYDNIDKIQQGRLTAAEDPLFFELAGDFLWRHAPEEFAALSVPLTLLKFGSVIHGFYSTGKNHKADPQDRFSDNGLMSLKEKNEVMSFFKIVRENPLELDVESNGIRVKQNKDDAISKAEYETYIAVISCEEYPFDIIISFTNSESNEIYVGIYIERNRIAMLKSHIYGEPAFFRHSIETGGPTIYFEKELTPDRIISKSLFNFRDAEFRDGIKFTEPGSLHIQLSTFFDRTLLEPIESAVEKNNLKRRVNSLIEKTGLIILLT